MTDNPQFQAELPVDGWLTVTVGGQPVTVCSVRAGESVDVTLTTDKPER
jgi:hypothetical protein